MTAGRDEVIAEIARKHFGGKSPEQKLRAKGCELAIREAISRVGGREAERDGWFLPSSEVNHIQVASINETIKRAKHAHYVDVRIRINGEYEFAQADWIKHMVATKEG